MLVTLRKREGITILEVEGRIAGPDSLALKGAIDGKLAQAAGRETKMLLKLGKVRMIDSAGLGVLIAACTAVKQRGGQIAMLNARNIKNLIAWAKLMMVFACYESEDEAVANLQ